MTVEALVKQLGSLWEERRERAVVALVEIGEPAVPALMHAARRRWWLAPTGAIEALGRIGDPQAAVVVRSALRSRRPEMRRAAIVAAGRLPDPEAIPILRRLYASALGGEYRALIRCAMAAISGDPETIPMLLRHAQDGTSRVREMARLALQRIGRLAPDRLAAALGSREIAVVAATVVADLGEDAVPGLDAVIQTGRKPAAGRALSLLAAMGHAQPEHRSILLTMLDDPEPTFRTAAASGLAHLSTQTPDPHLRAAIHSLRKKDSFGASPLERRFYRDAITAIEQATAHLQQLPVPVDSIGDRTTVLPLPAAAEATNGVFLPLPSEDREPGTGEE